jgi:hypothetical protein
LRWQRLSEEVAGLLDLSEKTVEFHKQHIRESFNLSSNADMVVFFTARRQTASGDSLRLRRSGQINGPGTHGQKCMH